MGLWVHRFMGLWGLGSEFRVYGQGFGGLGVEDFEWRGLRLEGDGEYVLGLDGFKRKD